MSSPLAKYTPERLNALLALASPEERAEIDLLLLPSLETLESDWRIWLKTLFPQFMRGQLAAYHGEYWTWLWDTLMAKRRGEPLPDGNAFMSIWARGCAKSTFARLAPIAEAALLGQGYGLYISGNQEQANKHLGSIETLLTSERMRYYYPQVSKPAVRNTDKNKAWNQKMLHTGSGYVLQAIGLDVGIRGANVDDMRITAQFIDDIDDRSDTILQSEQKMDKFLHSILPTKKPGTIFICAQNLVLETGVINRIFTGEVPALANAHVSGPYVRVQNLKTEQRTVKGRQRDFIIGGECTWPADSLEVCQEDIDTYTLMVFLRECQHQLAVDRSGLVLSPWDDSIHVITESEFQKVFGYPSIPRHWPKEMANDWADTKSAYHANVAFKLAVSSQNEPLPGCLFIYDAMSFEAGTQADDVAIRLLKSIAPQVTVKGVMKDWDEVLRAEFERHNLEQFVSSATSLIKARRDVLARVIPPLVGPLLKQYNFRHLKNSHEAKDQRLVFRRVYGLPFNGVNPRKEGGIEFARHYLRVDPTRKHPFKETMGWTQMYVVVPDSKKGYPIAIRPDSLHDSDLLRYQFSHHRYSEPHLTNSGIIEHGPEKMNDDFTNALQMCLVNGGPLADALTYNEQVEEVIPKEFRLETLMKVSETSLTGRKTMSPADQMAYALARDFARKKLAPRRQSFNEYLEPET